MGARRSIESTGIGAARRSSAALVSLSLTSGEPCLPLCRPSPNLKAAHDTSKLLIFLLIPTFLHLLSKEKKAERIVSVLRVVSNLEAKAA